MLRGAVVLALFLSSPTLSWAAPPANVTLALMHPGAASTHCSGHHNVACAGLAPGWPAGPVLTAAAKVAVSMVNADVALLPNTTLLLDSSFDTGCRAGQADIEAPAY